jgi:hypothetical protein
MKSKGDVLNKILNLGAAHSLYRENGKWYHHLKNFPGILFDRNGLLVFETEIEYKSNDSMQLGEDLNIPMGISRMVGYREYTKEEKEAIKLIFGDSIYIDEMAAWKYFLQAAKKYELSQEIFVSPVEQKRYQITDITRNTISIKRLDVVNSAETIGREKFKTCIKRINALEFPIPKGTVYEHVLEETTIVELLPMLDWSESGSSIIYLPHDLDETESQDVPEAQNDDVSKKTLAFLNVRRGQKKLRVKLFYLYTSKCAISSCNVKDVLHACHIISFAKSGNNMSTNALLLRSDLHDLFDANFIAINPDNMKVAVHESLKSTTYFEYNGRTLNERIDKIEIDKNGLNLRWELFNNH